MARLSPRGALLLLLACAGVSSWAWGRREAGIEVDPELRERLPEPTEVAGDEEALHEGRREWIEAMHRAPPGVDWREVERRNGLAQVEKRNRLAVAPPAADPWVERGSDNQAGRMHVARPSTDGTLLYAGSSNGGVWVGEPDGTDWRPIGDNLYGGAHWLETLPPDVSGEPDVVLVATDGGLVHRTADDGATWVTPAGLPELRSVRRLLTMTDGAGAVLLVAGASGTGSYALWRSLDRGASFEEVYDFGTFGGDVWAPRDGGAGLWMVADDGVYRSDDDGDSFAQVGTIGDAGSRGAITGSEAGAPRLWVALTDRSSELWRSDDAGATWSDVTAMDDFWGRLDASIVDVDRMAWGGMELHATSDGERFTSVNRWDAYYGDPANQLHADIFGLAVVPDGAGGEAWYIGCDGGLYQSTDGLDTVHNLSLRGLRVGQYYSTLTSSADPTHVALGAQDQGYQLTTDVAQDDDLYEVDQALSGDYGHLTSGDGTHAYVYSVYPGFVLAQVGETRPTLRYVDFPSGESYNWLPVVLADPTDPSAFFFGAEHLWRYTAAGRGWTGAIHSEQEFSTGRGDFISAMTFSPLDSDRMWVVTYDGAVWRSGDHGDTWTASRDGVPGGQYFYGQAVVASHVDADTVYVGGSGYGNPAVYRSTDGGATWEPYGDGLPDTLVYSLAESAGGVLFAGTETAAYRRDPGSAAWVDITGAAAPVTVYWSAEALPGEDTIRFGTYGRGVWDYRLGAAGGGCEAGVDADGDGVDCLTDCDDTDASVTPGREDACDGVDADCDPATPDEADRDGDGALACEECDDGDATVHPGATDVCGDGIDQDCDGEDPACRDGDGGGKGGGEPGGCGCAAGAGGAGGGAAMGAAALLALAATVGRRRT